MIRDLEAKRPGFGHVFAQFGLFAVVAVALVVAVGLEAPSGVLLSIMAIQLVGMGTIAWFHLRAWDRYFRRRHGKGIFE